MPIYDYLCTACDHRADILLGINDAGPTFCPSCGAEGTMRKQFAAPAIHFKGSGWAKKDRGGSSVTKAAAKSGEGSGSGGESKSESASASSGSGGEGGSNSGKSGDSGGSGGSGSSGSSDSGSTSSGGD
jgi:putative FmdB family regulatory protein